MVDVVGERSESGDGEDEAATTTGSVYDVYRPPGPRRMRDLPRLIWSASVFAWSACPRQLTGLMALQVVAGLGTGVQLLIGSRLVAAVLRADRAGSGIGAVLPTLGALVFVTFVLSFLADIRAELQRLMGEKATRHALGQIIDVATTVEFEAYERPGFHDHMKRAQLAAAGRALNLVSGLATTTGAILSVLGLIVGLLVLAPLLVPFVVLGYIPLWVASIRNSESTYHFGWNWTRPDRLRYYLAELMTSKASAEEIRVFGLGDHIRPEYERLYDSRMAEMVRITWVRLRRSLLASLVGSTLGAGALTGSWRSFWRAMCRSPQPFRLRWGSSSWLAVWHRSPRACPSSTRTVCFWPTLTRS